MLISKLKSLKKGTVKTVAMCVGFYSACRIALFFCENDIASTIIKIIILILLFAFAAVFGFISYDLTERLIWPNVLLVMLGAVLYISDTTGTISDMHGTASFDGYLLKFMYYIWISLRYGAVSIAMGIFRKNTR